MKIEVIKTPYPIDVPNGSIMTVSEDFGGGNIEATIDGGDGFAWFMHDGTYHVINAETRDPELTSPYGDGNHPLPPTTGTLKELNVKPGGVVEYVSGGTTAYGYPDEPQEVKATNFNSGVCVYGISPDYCDATWRIISRASDNPDPDLEAETARMNPDVIDPPSSEGKTWGDMTDAEKGALLLAHHRER